MLEGSYGIAVSPRSHIVHYSADDEKLLCGRRLLGTGYECVDVVDAASVGRIMWNVVDGQFMVYYRSCTSCLRRLSKDQRRAKEAQ